MSHTAYLSRNLVLSPTCRADLLVVERDGTFEDFFGPPETFHKKWLTPEEVGAFLEKHQDKLTPGGAYTFFLMKEDFNEVSSYFVVTLHTDVMIDEDHEGEPVYIPIIRREALHAYDIAYGRKFSASIRYRLVTKSNPPEP